MTFKNVSVKTSLILTTLAVASASLASADLPFGSYYGKYEVVSCKKMDGKNVVFNYCDSKKVLVEKGAACEGAPRTNVFFATEHQEFDIAPCTRNAANPPPVQESFIPGEGLNAESFKYEKEKDGSDHHFLRRIVNEQTSVFTDFWMKKNANETISVKIKRREAPKDDEKKTQKSFEYELILKQIK